MYILDRERFDQSIRRSGFRSVNEFCTKSGLPRSTLNTYLLDQKPVFTQAFLGICKELDVDPHFSTTQMLR